ncbi:MAG: YceI family protein [Chloroflexi bacterium]|nr:YceI family protein [Chloroflexota bacterium]
MTHSNLPETIHKPRRRHRRFFGGCALIVLLPILTAVYWFFIRDVEAKENKLQFATPVPESKVYAVSKEDSLLNFTILGKVHGTIDISGENFTLEPTEDGQWHVVANMQLDGQSTKTESGEFIDFVLKAGLKADEYPYGRFVARSIETFADPTNIPEQAAQLVGDLEISGVVNTYTLDCTVSVLDGVLTVYTTPTIDLKEFGVNFPEQIGSSEMTTEITVKAYLTENGGEADATTPADTTN